MPIHELGLPRCMSIFRIRDLTVFCSAGTAANEPHQDTPAQNGSARPRATRLTSEVAHIAVGSQRATDSSLPEATNQASPELCPRRFAVIWGLATSSRE